MTLQNSAAEYDHAAARCADAWVPACGGAEVPFQYAGTSYLYVWNPARAQHGWLNLSTDIVQDYSPVEAQR